MNTSLSTTQKWLIALFLALIALGGTVRLIMSSEWYARRADRKSTLSVSNQDPVRMINVDVDGAVKTPGVYRLPRGATLGDAVHQAGGRARGADTRCMNMTDTVLDRQKIYVPFRSENLCSVPIAMAPTVAGAATGTAEAQQSMEQTNHTDPDTPATGGPSEGSPQIVNINTAAAEMLETLPGIGPTYSRRIVELRAERGPYRTIEEIMLVNGIGPAKFDKLKHLIKVTD